MKLKINRLLEITILLLNRGTATAKELAEKFEVSTRTIYRDLDVLSSAGVQVFTNKGNGGGISLLEDYSLNKTLISEHEWVYGYLLSFGNYVEILEPQHIREIIADRARKLLDFYGKQ